MHVLRFTTCTNNFVRIHESLRMTLALAVGVTEHLRELRILLRY